MYAWMIDVIILLNYSKTVWAWFLTRIIDIFRESCVVDFQPPPPGFNVQSRSENLYTVEEEEFGYSAK